MQQSAASAGETHHLLAQAGLELTNVDRLISAIRTSAGEPLSADAGVEVAVLAGRTKRLSILMDVATPLAERVQRQLTEAQRLLERQVSSSARPDVDRFQRFWALDVGIFEGSRAVARARASARDGPELAERAVHTGAVTSMHVRDLQNHHARARQLQGQRHQPPAAGSTGRSI